MDRFSRVDSMADACARRRIRRGPGILYVYRAARGALQSASACNLRAHVREPTALPREPRDGSGRV
jgi:hypothetical protein